MLPVAAGLAVMLLLALGLRVTVVRVIDRRRASPVGADEQRPGAALRPPTRALAPAEALDTSPYPVDFVPLSPSPGRFYDVHRRRSRAVRRGRIRRIERGSQDRRQSIPPHLPVQWLAMIPFWGAQLVALGGVIAGGWSWKGFVSRWGCTPSGCSV